MRASLEKNTNITIKYKEWPLKKDFDEAFFGYLTGIGWENRGEMTCEPLYIEAEYGGDVVRYLVPEQDKYKVFRCFSAQLADDFEYAGYDGYPYNKYYIKQLPGDKYTFQMP